MGGSAHRFSFSSALEPTSWMSSGNRSTLTINWRWYRHATEYTQETRHNFFLLRDFAGIGSAPRHLSVIIGTILLVALFGGMGKKPQLMPRPVNRVRR